MKSILIEVLKNEVIGHAVLDVFETEPLTSGKRIMGLAELYGITACIQSYPVSMLRELLLYLKGIWKNG